MSCTTDKGPFVNGLTFTHLLSTIDESTRMTFLAMLDGKPIAQADVADWERPGGWITWVFVEPEWQRHGVGHALLKQIMAAAFIVGKEGLALSVKRENLAARALYEAVGFRYIYSYDADTYAMGVHLSCTR